MSDFKVVKLLDPISISLNLSGPNFTGAYNGATAYVTGDSVSYLGSSYVALSSTTGNLPTNTSFWQLLASKGDAGAGFIYTQSTPSSTWTINHNLGFNPTTVVFTSGGLQIEPDILHTTINQTIIYMNTALSGTARLN